MYRGSMAEGTNTETGVGMTWTPRRHRASVYAFEQQDGLLHAAKVHPTRILFGRTWCGPYCDWAEYTVDTVGMKVDVVATRDHQDPRLWPALRPRNPLCSCRRSAATR